MPHAFSSEMESSPRLGPTLSLDPSVTKHPVTWALHPACGTDLPASLPCRVLAAATLRLARQHPKSRVKTTDMVNHILEGPYVCGGVGVGVGW